MSGLLEEYPGRAPLAIVHPHGGVRIIAALTIGEQGIAFADVGWTQQPSTTPCTWLTRLFPSTAPAGALICWSFVTLLYYQEG